jgi:arylsulfatase A-like enzyme
LRRAGYVTASFVTNPFAGKASGLERGFDFLTEYSFLNQVRSQQEDRGVHSAELHQAVAEWLEHHRDEPFFLYVHSSDPHAPYHPPQEFESKFANPAESAQFHRDEQRLRSRHIQTAGAHIRRVDIRRMGINPDRFLNQAMERYDAEIAYNDSTIEQLAGKLKELGVLNNTLIIVVSDHGEEFWEHGWMGHGHSLYQELTQAAWLMSNPGLLGPPRRITEPVQLLDLVPTVLDLLNIRPSGVIQGQSLVQLVRDRRFERRTPVMSSCLAYEDAKTSGDGVVEGNSTFALITSDWKLIWRKQAQRAGPPEIELFDRRADRADMHDVSAQQPETVHRLKAETDEWIQAQQQVRKLAGVKGEIPLSTVVIRRLRSLGYVGK